MAKRIGFKDRRENQRYAQVTDTQYAGIVRFIKDGKKINAIKAMREFTGLGLIEAKLAVEALQRKLGTQAAPPVITPGATPHRGNPRVSIVGLRDTQARGRNGQFRATKIDVANGVDGVTLKVWSTREGKNPPISLDLCERDAAALRDALSK